MMTPLALTDWIRFAGPNHSLELFEIRLVGINADNGKKLLFSVALVVVLVLLSKLLRAIVHAFPGGLRNERVKFWTRQGIRLTVAVLGVVGLLSIWFEDPARLGTFVGLVTAGVAFALQRVVTALAGYLLILRGKTFNVGDRITMGGVRGDVVALGFLQTTIMEMGQPPAVQSADPAMWVKSRQYTGRIVTVTNDKVFDQPIFNYTREFPCIWEELTIPIPYKADRTRAEQILLDAARRHTLDVSQLGEDELKELERRYVMRRADVRPRVYWRMTDNWLELTVRFLCRESGVRDLKDAMARDILPALDAAHIDIASATSAIVEFPPLRIERVARASV
jgi:small-conductance mechanosensitive channel